MILVFFCSCCGLCTRRMPSPKVGLSSAAVPTEPQRVVSSAVRIPSALTQTLFPLHACSPSLNQCLSSLEPELRRKKEPSHSSLGHGIQDSSI